MEGLALGIIITFFITFFMVIIHQMLIYPILHLLGWSEKYKRFFKNAIWPLVGPDKGVKTALFSIPGSEAYQVGGEGNLFIRLNHKQWVSVEWEDGQLYLFHSHDTKHNELDLRKNKQLGYMQVELSNK
jgi:hypothetical protein